MGQGHLSAALNCVCVAISLCSLLALTVLKLPRGLVVECVRVHTISTWKHCISCFWDACGRGNESLRSFLPLIHDGGFKMVIHSYQLRPKGKI